MNSLRPQAASLAIIATFAALAAGCSSGPTTGSVEEGPPAGQATSSPKTASASAMTPSLDEWRHAMSKALPKDGCFRATPPSTTWEEVPCGTGSAPPLPPAMEVGAAATGIGTVSGIRPEIVGGGGSDFSALEGAGTISWAQGSFPIVAGMTTASDGAYSIQLNTNMRPGGALCSGPNCDYWQQFTYDSVTNQLYIQSWLVGSTACPSSAWTFFPAAPNTPGGCYVIGPPVTLPNHPPITSLGNLSLTGAAGSSDTVTMWTDAGQLWGISQPSVLGLNEWWTAAEYNVFGAENSTINLNSGTSIVVQTLTENSSGAKIVPSCDPVTTTAESNNLTVVPNSCCAVSDAATGIWFTETYPAGGPAEACPDTTALVPGGGIAASNQFGLRENTDLFSIDKAGAMTLSWAAPGAWTYPVRLSQTGLYTPGAPVAASQQFGLTQTDVFAVDIFGHLDVTWVGSGSWLGPMYVGSGEYPSAANLAVAQQLGTSSPQTDIFVVDNYGALSVTWYAVGGSWQSAEITKQGLFPPGAPLAASPQFGLTQTDVFLVGNNGQLEVVWVDGQGSWNGPEPVGTGGQFPPRAYVVASNQFGLPINTDVFAIDAAGNPEVAWVNGSNPFEGPVVLAEGSQYPAGAPLAVSQQFGVDATGQTDVFMITRQGFLNVMWVEGANSWQGPSPAGEQGPFYPIGGNITASQQFGIEQTDVFVADNYGNRAVTWAEQANIFQGPSEIP